MFKQDTLFILGAGASVPYGYPLGNDLINNIIDIIENDLFYLLMSPKCVQTYRSNQNSIDKIIFHLNDIVGVLEMLSPTLFGSKLISVQGSLVSFEGHTFKVAPLSKINEFNNLKNALIEYDPVSIDAFLNHHPQYAEAGKIMITYALLSRENKSFFPRRMLLPQDSISDNWYSYILNDIMSGCNSAADITQNKLNIITFNYDMSLDYYLSKKLSEIEILNKNKIAIDFINQLTGQIHHVYGKIHEDIPLETYGDYVNKTSSDPMNPAVTLSNMRRFLKSIHTRNSISLINDERSAKHDYLKLIKKANRIIIIGFGFDRDNLNILGFPEKDSSYTDLLVDKQVMYLDYKGRMNSLADQFENLKKRNSRISITRSIASTIVDAYQFDFKIYLY